MSDSDSKEDSGEEDEWPPDHWLAPVVAEDKDSFCDVLSFIEAEDPKEIRTRIKEVRIPNPFDVAQKVAQPRSINIRKYSTLLLVASPTDPPYIGLVTKIWMKSGAQPLPEEQQPPEQGVQRYKMSDFNLELLWFYRVNEANLFIVGPKGQPDPHIAKNLISGAVFEGEQEGGSERQVLFSSHATSFDDAEDPEKDHPDKLGISLESVLQECQIHWLGPGEEDPKQVLLVKGRLVERRAPGFFVRYFHHYPHRKAFRLGDQWPDRETQEIVVKMTEKYKKVARRLKKANEVAKQEYERLQGQRQQQQAGEPP